MCTGAVVGVVCVNHCRLCRYFKCVSCHRNYRLFILCKCLIIISVFRFGCGIAACNVGETPQPGAWNNDILYLSFTCMLVAQR